MSAVRVGVITAATRRRWAVRAAAVTLLVLVLTPVFAIVADAATEVPIDGFTASGVLALFFTLALLVLLVANLVWAGQGEHPPAAPWLPWLAVAFAALGLVVAGLSYDAADDGASPLMLLIVIGLAFTALTWQSLRIARSR